MPVTGMTSGSEAGECGSEVFVLCGVQDSYTGFANLHFKAPVSDPTFLHWFCPW